MEGILKTVKLKNISQNLTTIKTAIAAAEAQYERIAGSVTLVAVSKDQPSEKIKEAIIHGQTHFGENYLQEALVKIKELANQNITWHYIGKIQSKKAKLIAPKFAWVETVANYETAQLLDKYRPADLPLLNICIQVNISNEANKGGVVCEEILLLAKKIIQLPKLKLRGLMAIPHYYKDFKPQLKSFDKLCAEFKKLQNQHIEVDTLSIGMSNDFVAAIASGATIVRIGTAIFGKRIKKNLSTP